MIFFLAIIIHSNDWVFLLFTFRLGGAVDLISLCLLWVGVNVFLILLLLYLLVFDYDNWFWLSPNDILFTICL